MAPEPIPQESAQSSDPALADALRRISELEEEVRALQLSLDVSGSIDPRTGLANRNGMVDAIEERRRWLEREGEPFTVMLVLLPAAVDGPHVAALLQAALRDVDRVASWDEWVLGAVLPGLTEENFDVVAGRVRRGLLLAQILPERVVFGVSADTPADQMLRAMEADADIAPGMTITNL